MRRPPLQRPTPRVGASSRRTIVVLMIVVAAVLLAAPVTAGAHVAKAHKKVYKANLEGFGKSMMLWKDSFDRTNADVDSAADQIGPLLGSEDPVDKENLNGLQLMEAQNAEAWSITWPRQKASFDNGIDDFCKRALPWFRTKADKQDLRDGSSGIKRAFAQLFKDGFGGITMEEQTLAEAVKLDDLVSYYAQREAAIQARNAAEQRFNRAIGILNDLQ
jgi:hypothetical protein